MRNKNYFKIFTKSSSGFTLIELLVVMAVVGILATISIVGFSNWRSNTNVAQIKSDLNGAVAAMEDARNFGNAYPATLPSSFKPTAGTTVTGGSIDGKTYCVQASISGVTYKSTNTVPTPTITDVGCIGTYTQTTPGSYTWVVPAGVSWVFVDVWGAQGGPGQANGCGAGGGGGAGGYSKGKLVVTPGETIYVYVGTLGGGAPGGGSDYYDGAGGAGGNASDVRQGGNTLTDRKIVAGGGAGGGGGYDDFVIDCYGGPDGGAGGGLVGGGSGSGTQSSGYSLGYGGAGDISMGGGGDGYYGGASGSGGSGYIGGVTNGTTTAGVRGGSGKITISFYYP